MKAVDFNKIEAVLIQGDLSKLSASEKVSYYNRVCESLGLNPLTKPFDYIRLNGKEVLYAKRDAADQLRKIYNVSVKITERQKIDDLLVVTAQASMPDGRADESIGVLSVGNLKGEALANAYMKCETKAKRRVTLSICGLGLLDETEIEDAQSGERDTKVKELTSKVQETEGAPEFEAADYFLEPEAESESEGPGDYVFSVGKRHKGKKLKDIALKDLEEFVLWADEKARSKDGIHPSVAQCRDKVREYIHYLEFTGGADEPA